MNSFIPQSFEIGQRVDKILKNRFPQFSRNWIQKLIAQGVVRVNGKKIDPDFKIHSNDKLYFELIAPPQTKEPPKADPKVKFKILYEDEHVAVIEKPSGLVVHPSDSVKWGTLVNGLLAVWPQMEGVGEDFFRPGIVHRLDRETSGVMVTAKTQLAYEHLKKQFQNRTVEKKYVALLMGRTSKLKGEINAPIGRSENDPMKRSVGGIKEAITLYEVIRRFERYTLVEAMPKTGRTHQLRVHFSYIGHPIAGDDKYTPKRAKPPLGLKRLFLHACDLTITLVSGKLKHFHSPLPSELAKVLEDIEKIEKSRK